MVYVITDEYYTAPNLKQNYEKFRFVSNLQCYNYTYTVQFYGSSVCLFYLDLSPERCLKVFCCTIIRKQALGWVTCFMKRILMFLECSFL